MTSATSSDRRRASAPSSSRERAIPCPWLAVPAAIDFQDSLGWQRIRGRVVQLAGYVRQRFRNVPGLSLATPTEPALHGAMTAFRLPGDTDPVALRRGLWQRYRIEAPVIERAERFVGRVVQEHEQQTFRWRYLIRVSTWWYNTEEEIERLATALSTLLPECRME